ncbi:MAG: HD domain-containing protein [Inquilinaceae bacterium]
MAQPVPPPPFKTQRILDPVHGLVVFHEESDIDRLAWRLINAPEFQRLRRIRQLGFCDIVFLGASHSRFAHCIGVYQTARRLLAAIRRKADRYDPDRGDVALCAALLHDLGHGPFSHAFEGVERGRGRTGGHERWTVAIIRAETQVRAILEDHAPGLADRVADLLALDNPTDLYSSLISSQFDADRLDYVLRDGHMTGIASGRLDYEWLLDCLEVGRLEGAGPGQETEGLYLNYKGLPSAENYLLARYQLYSRVYLHKTSRSAERMLRALLVRVSDLARDGSTAATGLAQDHALLRYLVADRPDVGLYLALDDALVLTALAALADAPDGTVAALARGLYHRRLYKCFDAGLHAESAGAGDETLARFRAGLPAWAAERGLDPGTTLLEDETEASVYGMRPFQGPAARQRVLIGDAAGRLADIADRSRIIAALPFRRMVRIYVPDADSRAALADFWQGCAVG